MASNLFSAIICMHYTCLFLASKIKTVKRIQTHDFGSMGTQYTFFGEHVFFVIIKSITKILTIKSGHFVPPRGYYQDPAPRANRVKKCLPQPPHCQLSTQRDFTTRYIQQWRIFVQYWIQISKVFLQIL